MFIPNENGSFVPGVIALDFAVSNLFLNHFDLIPD
jgi:hypothetical protein